MADYANQGRGSRRRKRYWWIVIGVAIAAGVGVTLFFSVPIFRSPGGGIGEPTNIQEEQAGATVEDQQPGEIDEGPGLGDRPLVGDQFEDEPELAGNNTNSS
ncbi:MAG: hypothetical protein M3275_01040 [Thermoproteota archaeon]|nr:hypothetical protein [Thermoproteota archaeon]